MPQTFNELKNTIFKHQYASLYNPTGNSISERINGQINTILRIYRGETLHQIKDMIIKRQNFTIQRTVGFSPYEVVYKDSPFRDIPMTKKIDLEAIQTKIKEAIAKSE